MYNSFSMFSNKFNFKRSRRLSVKYDQQFNKLALGFNFLSDLLLFTIYCDQIGQFIAL